MKLKITFIIAFFLFFLTLITFGQKTYLSLSSASNIKYKSRFQDKTQLDAYLLQKVEKLKKDGYAEANIDSLNLIGDSAHAFLHIGPQYTWSELSFDSIPSELLSSFYSRIKRIEGKNFNTRESKEIAQNIVNHYENNGYPFAKVQIDSLSFSDYTVEEKITLIKGPFIVIDSISIKGELKINPHVVYRITDIKPRSIYSEKKVQSIENNLQNVNYLESIRSPEFYFSDNKNILFLYLDKKKSNRFSGIIGFQNDPVNDKLTLTGDLSLGLNNVFKQGEWMNLNWNRFQNASQKLNISIGFPYIFKSPIGVAGSLDLFKQDSTFIDVQLEGSFLFSINRNSRAQLSISSRQSNSLSAIPVNSNELANVSLINYSLGIEHNSYDYKPNPRKGFGGFTKLTLSNKEIKNQLEGDSITSDPIQYQALINIKFFIPTFSKQTIVLMAKAAAIFNDHIFQNEMFRLGGLSTIRGFNEESIYASHYGIGTFEYRYLYEKNANIRVFTDMGMVKNQGISNDYNFIFGFGIGASLETKAGIFNIDYAMGKQNNQLLQISDAKVHIGYVNSF